ncbi:MAG: lamin tail domain-containing protein [Verrucomicrobiota bacterium]
MSPAFATPPRRFFPSSPLLLASVLALAARPQTASAAAFDSVAVINEVQYHPAGANQTEWIELRSLQGVDVNLSNWALTGGINFKFPVGYTLPGGAYIVIAAVPSQIPGALGPFTGSLNNAGDTVRLVNQNGRIMDELEYSDSGDWPVGPDGGGVTLARRKAGAGDNPPQWTASNEIGGTPGRGNFLEAGGAPTRVRLVSTGATWSYLDNGTVPAANWRDLSFDAAAWAAGPGLFTGGGGSADAVQPALSAPAASILGWWKLDGTEGTAAVNSVDGKPAGTLVNGVAWVNDPVRGQVAEFDGVDDRVSIADAFIPRQSMITDFTWTCWVKSGADPLTITAGDANSGPVEQGGAVILGNRSKFDGSGSFTPLDYIKMHATGASYTRTGIENAITYSTPLSDTGVWHHLAFVKKQEVLTAWRDGRFNGTKRISAAQTGVMPFFIGGDPLGTAECFKGRISDVAVWSKALPQRAIAGMAGGVYTPLTAPTTEAAASPVTPPLPSPVVTTTVQAGPEPRYFRTVFNYSGTPSRAKLELWPVADDGAVYYLNGVEIYRNNVPVTVPITNAAFPTTAIPLPGAQLRHGDNVLSVEVSQTADGNDLLFGADLVAVETPAPPADTAPSLIFSEISGSVDPAFKVELTNASAAALDLTGWTVTSSSGKSVSLAASSLAAGARLVLDTTALGFTPAVGERLSVVAATGYEITDSRVVTGRLRGLTADGQWGHPDGPSFGAPNTATVSDAVVINEIFYKSRSGTDEQWLELHNKSAAAVIIGGWKFSDGVDYLFPAGTTIPAGGYLVVTGDMPSFAAAHPGVPALGPWSGSLSGKGELIRLRDGADNVADEVPYFDSGRWPSWADGSGCSLELKDPNSDNSRGESWTESNETSSGKWETITYQGLGTVRNSDPTNYNEFVMGLLTEGDVLIDDISVIEDPAGTNRELIQNGNFSDGNLTGTNLPGGSVPKWRMVGNHRHSMVVDDPDSPGNKVLKLSTNGPTEHMANHAETTLKFGTSFVTLVASRTYKISLRARWLRGSNQLNTRLWFNRLPKTTLLSAADTGGTPGAVNSTRTANAGPTFANLSHSPVVPAVNAPATVSVIVNDPQGLASVELFTATNGAAFVSAPMAAGQGGQHSAVIPGKALSAKVQFYVKAVDTLGAVSFFPADGPDSRAIIPWNDNASNYQLSTGGKPHNLRVVMTAADQTFIHTNTNQMSNEKLPCTVIYDDQEVYYNAAVRLKSSEHGRFNDARVGYILDFGRDEPFLGTHTTVAVDRSGGIATNQYEILIKAGMNGAGGIYTTEDDIIRIIGTKTNFTGPAIFSKSRFDSEYLDGQWENGADGTVFKYERVYVLTQTVGNTPEGLKYPQDSTGPPGVAVASLGTVAEKENYRWYWLIRNNRDQDDYSKIIPAVTALGKSGATFLNETAPLVDGDSFLRSLTGAILFGATDNYVNNSQHNAIFYTPPGGKMLHIPWDFDYLDQSNASASLTPNSEQTKFISNAAWKRIYWGHVLDFLNKSFNDAFITKWATHYSKFGVNMADTTSLNYLRARAIYARAQVSTAVAQVPFRITTAGPLNVATPTANVRGDGWVDVASIRLRGNDSRLPVTWTDADSWSIDVPVRGGTQVYVLEALDRDGAVIGSAPITITATGTLFAAAAGTLIVSEINYNPSGSGDLTEFVELLNITGDTLDLSACHFDDENSQGIGYTFPAGAQLAPGARILVVKDTAAMTAFYGAGLNMVGNFTGGLDNAGESLVLYAANGQEIFRFAYKDNLASTDGEGRTLVRVINSSAPDVNDFTWRESAAMDGSPGTSDALVFTGDPAADADGDGCTALVEYAFGTSDANAASRPGEPTLAVTPDGRPTITWPLAPNADDVTATIQSSTGLSGWQTWDPATAAAPARFFRLLIQKK